MSQINHAFARLELGKARYRIVWTRISDSLFAIEGMRDQSFSKGVHDATKESDVGDLWGVAVRSHRLR
jgi:hypothetical protein